MDGQQIARISSLSPLPPPPLPPTLRARSHSWLSPSQPPRAAQREKLAPRRLDALPAPHDQAPPSASPAQPWVPAGHGDLHFGRRDAAREGVEVPHRRHVLEFVHAVLLHGAPGSAGRALLAAADLNKSPAWGGGGQPASRGRSRAPMAALAAPAVPALEGGGSRSQLGTPTVTPCPSPR